MPSRLGHIVLRPPQGRALPQYCALAFAVLILHASSVFCVPTAQMVGDPSGPWNSNGAGLLNSSCVPLTEEFTEQLLAGSIGLDSPIAYRALLTATNAVGNPFGKWETPLAIRAGMYIYSAMWDAAVAYSEKAIPIVKNGIDRRPQKEHTITNTNTGTVLESNDLDRDCNIDIICELLQPWHMLR